MKVKAIIKRLEFEGWKLVRTRGSHRQFKLASERRLVTVPGKPNDNLAPGTLRSIFKQAGWN
jgi:predicted RNA binding protein YcfA (HicA-like mRNA interferase family)